MTKKKWEQNGASSTDDGSDSNDYAAIAASVANRVVERVQSNPVSTLAAAFGVGYVLGGGLPTFALRIGAAVAVRAISNELLKQVTGGMSAPSFEPSSPTIQPSE